MTFTGNAADSNSPSFWRGTFDLAKPGDTFLDLRGWRKGDVWVNGHCLGRYWNIGPSQTAYAPGCWLHAGKNQVVILDLLGPARPEIAGLAQPIPDDLHLERDFRKPHVPVFNFNLGSSPPGQTGSNAPVAGKPRGFSLLLQVMGSRNPKRSGFMGRGQVRWTRKLPTNRGAKFV